MKKNDKEVLKQLGIDNIILLIEKYADNDESFYNYLGNYFQSEDENYQRLAQVFENIKNENEFTLKNVLTNYFKDIELLISDCYKAIELIITFYDNWDTLTTILDDYYYNNEENYDFFSIIAKGLLFKYIRKCDDRKYVLNKILKLIFMEGFDTDYFFVSGISKSLTKDEQRLLVSHLLNKSSNLIFINKNLIANIAKNIPDGELFEEALASNNTNKDKSDLLEIVSVYCEEGKYEIALNKMAGYAVKNSSDKERKLELLIKIHEGLGNVLKEIEYSQLLFEIHPTLKKLQQLTALPISLSKNELINKQINKIFNSENNEYFRDNMKFLFDVERYNIAEIYFYKNIKNREELVWYNYDIINNFLKVKNYLIVTILYRDVVLKILDNARTKEYDKAVNLIKKLEDLSHKITDWKQVPKHDAFWEYIHKNHGRKYSFWKKYHTNAEIVDI